MEKLDDLGKRRKDIETGLESLSRMIDDIEREAVNQEIVMLSLGKFTETFENIKPHKQKELLRLALHKAILSEEDIKIALYGHSTYTGLNLFEPEGDNSRSQTSEWLPSADSNHGPSD